jgi:hypothetical protein
MVSFADKAGAMFKAFGSTLPETELRGRIQDIMTTESAGIPWFAMKDLGLREQSQQDAIVTYIDGAFEDVNLPVADVEAWAMRNSDHVEAFAQTVRAKKLVDPGATRTPYVLKHPVSGQPWNKR